MNCLWQEAASGARWPVFLPQELNSRQLARARKRTSVPGEDAAWPTPCLQPREVQEEAQEGQLGSELQDNTCEPLESTKAADICFAAIEN